MKTFISSKIIFGAAGLLLAAIGVAWQSSNSNATTQMTDVAPPAAAIVTTTIPPAVTPATMPSSIIPGSPLAQAIRLTEAGIDQDIIFTFITNSPSMFNLDTDKIIYMADIGVPSELVTAMMQRDWKLKQQFAAAQQAAQVAQDTQNEQATPPAPSDTAVETDPVPVAEAIAPPPAEVTVDYFNNTLSPYGSWVEVAGYGRCWRPTVVLNDSSWQPYANGGHWVYTDNGWYWQSDYSWGATFHYGRWFRDTRMGWCWWPDTQWSPSWVTWRYSGDYCGWSPLPPHTAYRSGVGFVYRGSAVSVGFDFGLGISAFTFVPTRYLCDPHPYRHRLDRPQATRIYNQTTVINNFNGNGRNRTVINGGIAPERISAVTRTPIRPVAIGDVTNRKPRGEQSERDHRPRFAGNSTSAASQPNLPQTTPSVTTTTQTPVQPGRGYGDRNNRNWSTPQTQMDVQPQSPKTFTRDYQNRSATFTQTPRITPPNIQKAPSQIDSVHAPAINPIANQRPTPSQWQRPAQSDTQRTYTRNVETRPNVSVPAQNRIGAPYSAPQAIQPQRNYQTRNGAANPTYSQPPAVTPSRIANGNPSGAPAQKFSRRGANQNN